MDSSELLRQQLLLDGRRAVEKFLATHSYLRTPSYDPATGLIRGGKFMSWKWIPTEE